MRPRPRFLSREQSSIAILAMLVGPWSLEGLNTIWGRGLIRDPNSFKVCLSYKASDGVSWKRGSIKVRSHDTQERARAGCINIRR